MLNMHFCMIYNKVYNNHECYIGLRFAASLLPRLLRKNPRSHHKGATGRVRTGD